MTNVEERSDAGIFAWDNLQRYLYDKPDFNFPDTKSLSADDKFDWDREMALRNRLLASSVGFGLGSSCSSEEPGWFRISCSVQKDALETGFDRLLKTLRKIEAEGWNSHDTCASTKDKQATVPPPAGSREPALSRTYSTYDNKPHIVVEGF